MPMSPTPGDHPPEAPCDPVQELYQSGGGLPCHPL